MSGLSEMQKIGRWLAKLSSKAGGGEAARPAANNVAANTSLACPCPEM